MTYLKRIPLAVAILVLLTACGSAPSTSALSKTSVSKSSVPKAGSVTATCQKVGAVLGDGPDPDSDPVGYAEAQVDPLRHIQTQDAALRGALGKLADAYQAFFASNGTKTAKEAVSVASSAVNSICPGAAS